MSRREMSSWNAFNSSTITDGVLQPLFIVSQKKIAWIIFPVVITLANRWNYLDYHLNYHLNYWRWNLWIIIMNYSRIFRKCNICCRMICSIVVKGVNLSGYENFDLFTFIILLHSENNTVLLLKPTIMRLKNRKQFYRSMLSIEHIMLLNIKTSGQAFIIW